MRTLLVLCAICLTINAWGTQPPRVEVREVSKVREGQFTLGEVATFAGMDAQLEARLRAVVLGTSPLPGLERTITREQIITRLRQHGFLPEAFDIVIPARAVVRREAHILPAQQIIACAIQKLRETAGLNADAVVECDAPVRDVSLPAGEPQLLAGEPRSLGGGLYAVPVRIACGTGAPAVSVNVRLRAKITRLVVVPVRAIRTGEAIGEQDVQLQAVTLPPDAGDFVTDPEEVIGKVARRPIAQGQPLKRSAVDAPAVVRAGQNVKLLVQVDGAVVEASAVALQDGKVGARIRAQVTDTRKVLLATVVEAGVLAVNVQ